MMTSSDLTCVGMFLGFCTFVFCLFSSCFVMVALLVIFCTGQNLCFAYIPVVMYFVYRQNLQVLAIAGRLGVSCWTPGQYFFVVWNLWFSLGTYKRGHAFRDSLPHHKGMIFFGWGNFLFRVCSVFLAGDISWSRDLFRIFWCWKFTSSRNHGFFLAGVGQYLVQDFLVEEKLINHYEILKVQKNNF